jgi:SAM-dependent methyltransferase
MTVKNLDAWSLPKVVDFYVSDRSRAAELYPSEAAMLRPVAPLVRSVLDIGCATGGFADAFAELNPAIEYVGVDTSSAMIARARETRRAGRFETVTGSSPLPFGDGSVDLVFSTGVLVHNPDYVEMIADMLRVSRRYVMLDMRLVNEPYSFDIGHSFMVVGDRFAGCRPEQAAASRVPYVVANTADLFRTLTALPKVRGVACHGYWGKANSAVTLPTDANAVMFTGILIVKGDGPLRAHVVLPPDGDAIARQAIEDASGSIVDSIDEVITP